MPLWPAAILAVLLALPARAQDPAAAQPQTGRCTGRAGPDLAPAGGAPLDFRRLPDAQKLLPPLKLLGYVPDERTGRLTGSDGKPLTDATLAWLRAPADFSKERPQLQYWVSLTFRHRLDEASCQMRAQSGAPLSRLEYFAGAENTRRALQQGALERLEARLSGLNASAPVPADLLSDMKALSASGLKLPPSVQSVLDKKGARVGELALSATAAYADSTRFFDGQRTLGSLVEAALPPVEGLTVKRAPSYFEPEEKRLGDLFAKDLEDRFSRTDAGRDILRRLSDKDGRVALPPILLEKVTQRPEDHFALAFYNDADRSVTMNYWTTMESLLARLPADQRAAKAKELADPAKLRKFLETHPKERGEVLDGIDDVFYHEFVHAWQARRDGMSLENLRGNVSGAYPIEWELEAFREQCRYDLTRATLDPMSLTRAYGGPDFCLGMLKNFDGFEDSVKLLFTRQSVRGNGAETLPEILSLQHQRESMARRLMNDGLFQRAIQALKLQGMFRGDEAVRDLQLSDAQRKRKFIEQRLPDLRSRVAQTLPGAYFDLKRPDLALKVLASLPPSTPGLAAQEQEAYRRALPYFLMPPPSFALNDRLAAYGSLRAPENGEWPAELWQAYWRDCALQAGALRLQAENAPTVESRRAFEKAAANWEKVGKDAAASIAKIRAQAAAEKDPAKRRAQLAWAAKLEAGLLRARRQGGGR